MAQTATPPGASAFNAPLQATVSRQRLIPIMASVMLAMMPIAMSIIGDILPPAERGKWQGLLVAIFGLSSIVGPTAGGWITDNWGWRWTFYVNMPVGAVALLVAVLVLPMAGQRRQHTIDYLGAATLVAGAVALLLGFSWAGTQYAWDSFPIIGLLVLS